MPQFMLFAHSNTASNNMGRCEWKEDQMKGSNKVGFPNYIYFQFQDKKYTVF